LAPPAARRDWRAADVRPSVAAVSELDREVLRDHWTRNGLMEHASVAAFARFTLELLALGAPSNLVALAQEAMGDEVLHARLAFGLASAYADEPIGPGALAIDGALDGQTPEHILETTIREGCIGESIAAVEAAEAARGAEDPVVRGILEKVAHDEARHAELAWRFVAWFVEQGGGAARHLAERAFAAAVAAEAPPAAEGGAAEDERWLRHGVVRGAVSRALRAEVLRRVVEPTARALLGARARRATSSASL